MRSLVSIGLLGTLFCVGLAGQETGGFSGFVWDPSGELVAAASVTAVNEDTGFRRTAETDAAGLWTAPYLYPGRYKLTVRKEGFRTIVQFGVPLHAAEATRVDFHLQIGDVLEVVTVSDAPRLAGSEDVEAARGGAQLDRPSAIERTRNPQPAGARRRGLDHHARERRRSGPVQREWPASEYELLHSGRSRSQYGSERRRIAGADRAAAYRG